MAFDYARSKATANRLIARFGQAVTLTTITSVYDPKTDANVETPVTQTGRGVEEAYRASQIDGTLIKAGDKRLLLSATADDGQAITPPKVNETAVTLGVVDWVVKAVEPLSPGGVPVMYTLQLRGAP